MLLILKNIVKINIKNKCNNSFTLEFLIIISALL